MNPGYLLRALRYLSPFQVAAHYAYRGVNRAVDLKLYYGLRLVPVRARAAERLPRPFQYRFVTPERLRQEATDPSSGLTSPALEAALAAGEECFGAFDGEVLASHLWFASRDAPLTPDVLVRFDPDYAFSRWAFTRADYRGSHLHAACKLRALEAFAERGRRGILSVVSVINFGSLKSSARIGCERVGLLLASGVAGRRVVWTSPQCHSQGLRLCLAR